MRYFTSLSASSRNFFLISECLSSVFSKIATCFPTLSNHRVDKSSIVTSTASFSFMLIGDKSANRELEGVFSSAVKESSISNVWVASPSKPFPESGIVLRRSAAFFLILDSVAR